MLYNMSRREMNGRALRLFRYLACALVCAALVGVGGAGASSESTAAVRASTPAQWKPWHLTSADQLRLKAPPAARSAQTKAELAQLRRLQRTRGPAQVAAFQKWNGQGAAIAWTKVAIDMLRSYRPRPPLAARFLAIFQTGLYDAMIAADDSRIAYARSRPAPAKLDKRLKPLAKTPASTYAPYEAAMAGAAERLLHSLFPGEPQRTFTAFANEAVGSRLSAGVNYRSDVQNARALGQKVADAVIARAKADNSTSTRLPNPTLSGEGYWASTPPLYEPFIGGPVGTWKTWLLSSPGVARTILPGPSAYGSPEFMRQLRQVLDVSRSLTGEQRQIANFWDDGPGTDTPAGHWHSVAIELIRSYRLAGPKAVRALAYLSTVEADAVIACWEAKFYWWSVRPITAIWRLSADGTKLNKESDCQANPSLCPQRNVWYSIISTPGFPSYPSGHSSFSGGAGKILTYFFPKAGETLNLLANQAAASRLYGGMHFDEDNRDGLVLGRSIADLAIARAKADPG